MPSEGKTSVYILMNADDQIIYVGVSDAVRRRLKQHEAGQPWWPEVTSQAIETYPTRADALRRENNLILLNRPRYNAHVCYTLDTDPLPASEDSLAEKFPLVIRVTQEEHHRLKMMAIERNTTMSAIIINAIQTAIDDDILSTVMKEPSPIKSDPITLGLTLADIKKASSLMR